MEIVKRYGEDLEKILFFLSKNLGDIGYYSIQKGVEE